MEEKRDSRREEIYSERVRAGKRTYFFDVKQTRSSDYYLTITESKRRPKDDGFVYEKHKIFLYREDFEKFLKALKETTDHVIDVLMDGEPPSYGSRESRDNYDDTSSEEENKEKKETVGETKIGLDDELSWE